MAAVAGLFLLDAAADLVEGLEAESSHDVEGVQDVGGVGQVRAQRVEVAAERIQRGGTGIRARHPSGPAGVQPRPRTHRSERSSDHVQQPAGPTRAEVPRCR